MLGRGLTIIENLLTQFMANQWTFIILVGFILVGASEWGLRTGFRLHAKRDEARKSQIGGVQGAVLGLLGLLLGFTFAMSVARYDSRRDLVLQEANVIGTTWLRAGLLPGDHPTRVRELLRRYLEIRLKYREVSDDPARLAEGVRDSAEIQKAIWAHAEAVAREAPGPIVVSFINALNDLIDTDAERQDAGRNHIPETVWVLVALVAAFGCFTSAYGSGAQGARSHFTSLFLPLLITTVIGLIFDIDHSLQGVISVSQRPMLELKEDIAP
jgi:hypothetical protein